MKLQARTSHAQMPRGSRLSHAPRRKTPRSSGQGHCPVSTERPSRSIQLTVPLVFCSSPFCSKPVKTIELELVVGQGENRARRKCGRVNQNSPTRLLIECQPDTWRAWGDFATFCSRENSCNLYRFPRSRNAQNKFTSLKSS